MDQMSTVKGIKHEEVDLDPDYIVVGMDVPTIDNIQCPKREHVNDIVTLEAVECKFEDTQFYVKKIKTSLNGENKRKIQEDEEELVGADSSNDDVFQKRLDEIIKKRKDQNKIRCQRYRHKKRIEAIVNSRISKQGTITVEEEEKIKRRKEQNKQNSQRYRDRKRATNLINLQTGESSKTVVNYVPEFQNFDNSKVADSPTRNFPYGPPTRTNSLSTLNEPLDCYDEVHPSQDQDDTPSRVPQLHEPIITNDATNFQNMSSHDIKNNTPNNHSQHYVPIQILIEADSSNDDLFQKRSDEISKKRKDQNTTRYPRYNDKKETDAIVNSPISKHGIVTVEEEEKIKRRKEQNKHKSQRYRDRKRATNLIDLHRGQSSKTFGKYVPEFQNLYNSQVTDPSTRSGSYSPPNHTTCLSTKNEPYIPQSSLVCDDEVHNYTSSQVTQLHVPTVTNNAKNIQNILPQDVQNNIQHNHSQQYVPIQILIGADSSNDDMFHKRIDEICNQRKDQNTISCQQNSDKEETDATVHSRISKHGTTAAEENKIKRRKEQNKHKSQRYRDRKRATNLINSQREQSSKTVVEYVPKCKNVHNSQVAGLSTRNVPCVPPNQTAGLSTENEPYISESHLLMTKFTNILLDKLIMFRNYMNQ